jgi:thiol-disulfide isomerase/thioredoxin
MKRRMYLGAFLLLLAAGAATARGRVETPRSTPTGSTVSDRLPANHAVFARLSAAGFEVPTRELPSTDFTLELLGGGSTRLSSYRGSLVLLNFWATWCPSCREEIPSMEKLYSTLKKKGFVLVAVDLSESRDVVTKFVTANRMTYPVLLDSSGSVGALYETGTIPSTYLIGRDGRILGRKIGSRAWDAPEVVSLFESLLAG